MRRHKARKQSRSGATGNHFTRKRPDARKGRPCQSSKEKNGKPGLYVTARCKYFWATVPFIERDPHRPEDVVTDGPDHAADAARYALMHRAHRASEGHTVGMF